MDANFDNLPPEVWSIIFSYLGWRDLSRCCQVNSRLNQLASEDSLWKTFCKELWILESKNGDQTWKNAFFEQLSLFGQYSSFYPRLKQAVNQVIAYCKGLDDQTLFKSLNPGLTCEEIHEGLRGSGLDLDSIPLDIQCFYQLCGGQSDANNLGDNLFNCKSFLFGTNTVYDQHRAQILLPFKSAGKFSQLVSNKFRSDLKVKNLPESRTIGWTLTLCPFTNVTQTLLWTGDSFKVCYFRKVGETGQKRAYFLAPHGDSFTDWFCHYVGNLIQGIYPIDGGSPVFYPYDPECVAQTGSVKVAVSTCFHPENSRITPTDGSRDGRYQFSYYITMSMDSSASALDACKLQSRHWEITDEFGHTETVDGPGVIGEYPTLKPGSVYSYVSCTYFPSTSGKMRGSFQFKRLCGGATFDVACPEFKMVAYPTVTLNFD